MIPIWSWTTAPARLALEPGWVHIYRLALDLPAEKIAGLADRLADLLSMDERERAARYRSPRDGQRFAAAHGQMRMILAGYLGMEPAAIQFSQNEYRKPGLAGANNLLFNLSHSQSLALLAVSSRNPVGIDIEAVHLDIDRTNISRRFFSPREASALAALPAHDQVRAFFACWTRKEAYIKGRGLGLSLPLDAFEVSISPDEQPCLIVPGPGQPPDEKWSLYDIDPGPGYAAALAVAGRIDGIRCRDWSF
jgi:4'-phosphopantetheinyl transferase